MDVVTEFGDPNELSDGKEVILLRFHEPLSASVSLPEDCTFNGNDRRVLRTTRNGIVVGRAALRSWGISGALFAGCEPLSSSQGLFHTVSDILRGVNTLVLVHNKVLVTDIVVRLPNVRVLVLYHDLGKEGEERTSRRPEPTSRLERLAGYSPGLGTDCLHLSPKTLCNLFCMCPEVRSASASPLDHACFLSNLRGRPALSRLYRLCRLRRPRWS